MDFACTKSSDSNCKRLRSLERKILAACGERREVSSVLHKDSANRIEAGPWRANILQSDPRPGVSRKYCCSIKQDQMSPPESFRCTVPLLHELGIFGISQESKPRPHNEIDARFIAVVGPNGSGPGRFSNRRPKSLRSQGASHTLLFPQSQHDWNGRVGCRPYEG